MDGILVEETKSRQSCEARQVHRFHGLLRVTRMSHDIPDSEWSPGTLAHSPSYKHKSQGHLFPSIWSLVGTSSYRICQGSKTDRPLIRKMSAQPADWISEPIRGFRNYKTTQPSLGCNQGRTSPSTVVGPWIWIWWECPYFTMKLGFPARLREMLKSLLREHDWHFQLWNILRKTVLSKWGLKKKITHWNQLALKAKTGGVVQRRHINRLVPRSICLYVGQCLHLTFSLHAILSTQLMKIGTVLILYPLLIFFTSLRFLLFFCLLLFFWINKSRHSDMNNVLENIAEYSRRFYFESSE